MRFDAGVFWHLLFSDAFLRPAWITVWVTFAAMTIGIVLGLVGGLAAASSLRAVRVAVRCYVVVFRYDALAELTGNWINLPALAAGVLALGVNEGAYMTEIVRAGLGAVFLVSMLVVLCAAAIALPLLNVPSLAMAKQGSRL